MDVNTNAPAPATSPGSAQSARLSARLLEYGTLRTLRRRRRYLGAAAILAALVWFALALLYYFNKEVPNALWWGFGATVVLPIVALLVVRLRQSTEAETARMLDGLLDDRQRVITSVELLQGSAPANGKAAVTPTASFADSDSPIVGAQLASTARMLDSVEPRVLYPTKMPVGPMLISCALVVLALGVWLLRGAGDDPALAAGGLPPSTDTTQAVATATALAGLPDSPQSQPQQDPQSAPPAPPATAQADLGSGTGASGDQTQPGGSGSAGSSGTTSQLSPQQAQQQADSSRNAEKSLQRLAQALDGQGVTQGVADDIRKGDYTGAGDALSDLGANNDQLSQDAKDSLAQNLDAAADDSSSTSGLQNAERMAAQALRNGDYNKTRQALEDLGQAVKDAGKTVVPQQDLARNFPTAQPNGSQSQGNQQGQPGQQGDRSQQGQGPGQGQPQAPGQQGDQSQQSQGQQGTGGQPDPGSNGSSPENGQSSNSSGGTSTQGSEGGNTPGGPGATGGSDPGLPGEGSKVEGPLGQGLDAAGNPFEIQGNDNPDPNSTRPGDPQQPSALTLDTGPGTSGGASGPSTGGPVDATGESAAPPVGRWGIIQRYFSQDQK
ncbi:MAG: hypothetical protein ABJA50_08695 [Chloroflexota bacterium]